MLVADVFKNVSWVFLEKVLKMLSPLIFAIVLARTGGVELYGIYSYINTLYTIFIAMSFIGLDIISVREISKNQCDQVNLLFNIFMIRIIWSIIVSIIYVFVIFYNGLFTFGVLFSVFSVVAYSLNTSEYYFQGIKNFRVIAIISVLIFPLFLLGKIAVILFTSDIEGKFLLDFIEAILYCSILSVMYFKNRVKSSGKPRIDILIIKNLLRSSIPLALNTLMVILYFKIDQIMLMNMLGAKELGVYSVGVQLSSLVGYIPVVLTAALFPYLVVLIDKEDFIDKIIRVYHLFIFIILVFVVCVYLFGGWGVTLLFGSEFKEATNILEILVLGLVFVFIGSVSGVVVIIRDKQWLSTLRSVISLMLNIILNYIFIPKYGVYGAAWASVISQFVSNYVLYWLIPGLRDELKVINLSVIKFPSGVLSEFKKICIILKRR